MIVKRSHYEYMIAAFYKGNKRDEDKKKLQDPTKTQKCYHTYHTYFATEVYVFAHEVDRGSF